ncbi:hypothetical protein AGMMS4956_09590 [Bacteroidia bacterium]|nr:hypothetical protein AGMMS4956_09590 [Bacteroidia bacterium]
MTLQERINYVIAKKGSTPYEISISTGVSQSTLSRLINGTTKKLNMKTASILAKYFHIEQSWLMTGKGEMLRDATTPQTAQTLQVKGSNNVGNVVAGSNSTVHSIDATTLANTLKDREQYIERIVKQSYDRNSKKEEQINALLAQNAQLTNQIDQLNKQVSTLIAMINKN